MNDEKADKIIELLEAIKQIQKQHAENYENAVRNQAESIALQKQAIKGFRGLVLPIVIVVLILIVIILAVLLPRVLRYTR